MNEIVVHIAGAGPSSAVNPHEPDGYAYPDKAHCRKCNQWLDGSPDGWRTLTPKAETWETDDPSTYTVGGLECS